MIEATLSSKNQIVIPKEVRTALGIEAGDKIVVSIEGSTAILALKPKDPLMALKGAGRGLYGRGYLKKERRSWD